MHQRERRGLEGGQRVQRRHQVGTECGRVEHLLGVSAASTMSVSVRGPPPTWVKRSPANSVAVVSSNHSPLSQLWGTWGVGRKRIRCVADVEHLAVAHRPGRTVGQVVQRHHARELAVDDLGLRCGGEELVHGAALVGLDVGEGDPAQVGERHDRGDAPRTRAGTAARIPVWNRNGCSSRTRNWLNVKPAGARSRRPRSRAGRCRGRSRRSWFPWSGLLWLEARPPVRPLRTIAVHDRPAATSGDPPIADPYSGVGRPAAWRASAAASARLRTPSLVRIRPTWCSAVLGEMKSRRRSRRWCGPGGRGRAPRLAAVSDATTAAASVDGADGWTPSVRSSAAARSRRRWRTEPFEARERGPRLGDGVRLVAVRGEHLGQLEAARLRASSGRSPAARRRWRRFEATSTAARGRRPRRRTRRARAAASATSAGLSASAATTRASSSAARARRVDVAVRAARPRRATASNGAAPQGVADELAEPAPQRPPPAARVRRGRGAAAPAARTRRCGPRSGSSSAAASSSRPCSMRSSARCGRVAARCPKLARRRRAEHVDHGRLGLRPPPGAAQHRAVRQRGSACAARGPAAEAVEHASPDEARPLLGAAHVADAIARREHRAEAHTRRRSGRRTSPAAIAASAASSRSKPSRTRPCVTSARPPSASASASRSRSPNSTAMASARSALASQVVDVGAVARHERQLEVAPLHARPDLLEQPPGPLQPAVAGGRVAEHPVVEVSQFDGDAAGRTEVAAVAVTPERPLTFTAGIVEAVVEEVQPGQQLPRLGQVVGFERCFRCRRRARQVARFERGTRRREEVHRPRPLRQRNRWPSSGKSGGEEGLCRQWVTPMAWSGSSWHTSRT